MTTLQIAERVIALRDVYRKTGMVTKRAQNDLLSKLSDQELAEVALEIFNLERTMPKGSNDNARQFSAQ